MWCRIFASTKPLTNGKPCPRHRKTKWNSSAMNAAGSDVGTGNAATKRSVGRIWGKIARIIATRHEGYRFSRAMENPGFIGIDAIQKTYLPMGFSNFKIEGRGLGSALILEFLLYYMTRPEYQLHVREQIYLDNMLDLF